MKFDALAVRQSEDGHRGRQPRVNVSLIFSKETFDSYFRSVGIEDIPVRDSWKLVCLPNWTRHDKSYWPWMKKCSFDNRIICVIS